MKHGKYGSRIHAALALAMMSLFATHAFGQATTDTLDCTPTAEHSCAAEQPEQTPMDTSHATRDIATDPAIGISDASELPASAPAVQTSDLTPPVEPDYSAATTVSEPTNDVDESGRANLAAPAADADGAAAVGVGLMILGLVVLALYFVPTLIALMRGHAYTGVIFALNLCGGWTGLGWLVAMIWAVWPKEKGLIDPVVGSVTGRGERNSGDALGAAAFGRERGYAREAATTGRGSPSADPTAALEQLSRLGALRSDGVIDEAEFQTAKTALLART